MWGALLWSVFVAKKRREPQALIPLFIIHWEENYRQLQLRHAAPFVRDALRQADTKQSLAEV